MAKHEETISLNPQFLNFLMSPEKADSATAEFAEALNLLASQNLRKFDPFDKVVLSNKGIDNPILTSFRTLAKTNNSLSDTFKIVHKRFMGTKPKSEKPMLNMKFCGCHPPPDRSNENDTFALPEEVYNKLANNSSFTATHKPKLTDLGIYKG